MMKALALIELKKAQQEIYLLLTLSFVLVAIVSFSVGFIYSQTLNTKVLLTLIVIFGSILTFVLYYIFYKLKQLWANCKPMLPE